MKKAKCYDCKEEKTIYLRLPPFTFEKDGETKESPPKPICRECYDIRADELRGLIDAMKESFK
jgi:hypothetical protein